MYHNTAINVFVIVIEFTRSGAPPIIHLTLSWLQMILKYLDTVTGTARVANPLLAFNCFGPSSGVDGRLAMVAAAASRVRPLRLVIADLLTSWASLDPASRLSSATSLQVLESALAAGGGSAQVLVLLYYALWYY